jgi:uncharacterized protein (TIGR00288 family)
MSILTNTSSVSYKNQRVGVFVDVQNMYHSAKNIYHSRVDFKEILLSAVSDRQLIRAFAYVITTESGDEKKFLSALSKQGFEIKEKDLQIFAGGMKKADWDVGMAVDAIAMADKLDVVVLVTGDGDFVPLVDYLKINKGCLVEVMAFSDSVSHRLVEVADFFIDLGGKKSKFLIKQ